MVGDIPKNRGVYLPSAERPCVSGSRDSKAECVQDRTVFDPIHDARIEVPMGP